MTTAPPSDDQEEISLEQVSIRRRLFNVRTMASLLFGLVLIYFLARIIFGDNFDWGEVAQLVGQADLGFLVLAFAMYYATFPVRGLRWQYILARSGMQLGLRDATEILFLSWFINCLVPAKLGDLYRAFLLRANYGASISRTLGTVFIERIADLIVIAVLALTAGFWSFRGRSRPEIDALFIIGFVLAIGLVLLLVGLRLFGAQIGRWLPKRIGEIWGRFQEGTTGVLNRSKHPRRPVPDGGHLVARGCPAVLRHPGARPARGRAGDQRIRVRRAGGRPADRDSADPGRVRLRRGGHHRRARHLRRDP